MHKSQTGNSFWDNNKDNIIDLYVNQNYSANKIGEMYQCWGSTIRYKLKEWGVKKHERPNKKYELNSHYFDVIDSEHKAYWYGFLFADGHVNEKGVSISLQKNDKYIIERFVKDIETNIPIKTNKDGNPIITIACKIMANSLLEKGFNHRKSYNVDFDKIVSYVPQKYMNHFIRGMFDGDGCIGIYHYEYFKSPQFHFGYTGLLNVCEFIGKVLGIDTKIQKEAPVTYTIKTKDRYKIIEIYNYLYRDATTYMDRKYRKFKEIELITFNDYNSGTHENR